MGSDAHTKLAAAKGSSYTRNPYPPQAATQAGQSKKWDTSKSPSTNYQPATNKKSYDKDWKKKQVKKYVDECSAMNL